MAVAKMSQLKSFEKIQPVIAHLFSGEKLETNVSKEKNKCNFNKSFLKMFLVLFIIGPNKIRSDKMSHFEPLSCFIVYRQCLQKIYYC